MNSGQDLLTAYIIGPFIKAWNLFFDVQLPEYRIHYRYLDINETYLLCFIPIVGLVIGLAAYFIAWFLYFIGGKMVAAVISPIIILIFTELLTHCRDSGNLVDILTHKVAYYNRNIGIDNEEKHHNFMYYYIFAGVFIIRVFCLGMIIYFNHFGWLITIYTLVFAFEGYLAADDGVNVREELIHAGANSGLKISIVAFVLSVIFGAAYFPAMLLAFISSGIIGYFWKRRMITDGVLNGINIGVAGKVIEILLLLIGIIYKIRF